MASTARNVAISLSSTPGGNDTARNLEVMLGELFYIVPNVTDIFNNSAYISGNLRLVMSSGGSSWNNENSFKLVGPNHIVLDAFTKNDGLHITGERNITEIDNLYLEFIYRKQSSYHDGLVRLHIKVVDCRVGFMLQYDNSQESVVAVRCSICCATLLGALCVCGMVTGTKG